MRLFPSIALPAAAALLAGCATTPQAGDTSPPRVTVRENTSGLPVVFTTDAAETPAPAVCQDGSRPLDRGGAPSRGTDNANFILHPNRSEAKMTFFFGDPSGIRSASVVFDARSAAVGSPDLPIETRPTHGGGTGRFRVWEFAETGGLRDLQALALEITPVASPPGVPIVVTATDGAGNALPAQVFFVAQSRAYCG